MSQEAPTLQFLCHSQKTNGLSSKRVVDTRGTPHKFEPSNTQVGAVGTNTIERSSAVKEQHEAWPYFLPISRGLGPFTPEGPILLVL